MINTRSARVAIAIATANGMRAPEWAAEVLDTGGHRGNVADMLHHLDCGRVLAAVDRCSEAVRCWLLLAYAADGYAPRKAPHVVTSELYSRYVRERNVKATPARLVSIASAVIGDCAHQYRSPAKSPAMPADYCRAIGIPTNQYHHIKIPVEQMRNMLDGMDAQGLGVVASELPYHIRDVA